MNITSFDNNKTCINCAKSDVCKYKEDFNKAKEQAKKITESLYPFSPITVKVECRKLLLDNSKGGNTYRANENNEYTANYNLGRY